MRRKWKRRVVEPPHDTRLVPCLFCERSEGLVFDSGAVDGGYCWVMCRACGATGPSARSEKHAVNIWNARKVSGEMRLPAQ